jgi:hypothetical protein
VGLERVFRGASESLGGRRVAYWTTIKPTSRRRGLSRFIESRLIRPARQARCIRGQGEGLEIRHSKPVQASCVAASLAILAAALALMQAPAAAFAADFTWTGTAAVNPEADNWSTPANWEGTVPAGSVGRLTFPALPEPPCGTQPDEFAACYLSKNDISGLVVNSISIDDGVSYLLSGNSVRLGRGGLTAAPSASDPRMVLVPQLELPLMLSAPQTWSIVGGSHGQQLGVDGAVTGESESLGIHFRESGFLNLSNDVEVGRVSISGGGGLSLARPPGSEGLLSLNGADGNPVELGKGSSLAAYGLHSAIGPLTVRSGRLQVGEGLPPEGTLTVAGSLKLDSRTNVSLYIAHGATPGTDFSQLRVSGKVHLHGAHLRLGGVSSRKGHGQCAGLRVGDAYPLIKTSGGLSGRFDGIADGATIPLEFCHAHVAPSLRIDYRRHALVATVQAAGTGRQ